MAAMTSDENQQYLRKCFEGQELQNGRVFLHKN